MKSLILSLLAVMLTGCIHPSMRTNHTSTRTADGSMGYHVTTPYGGWPESQEGAKERAIKTLDRHSNGICKNGYTKTGEQESIFVNQFGYGSGVVKNLVWEIKCNKA